LHFSATGLARLLGIKISFEAGRDEKPKTAGDVLAEYAALVKKYPSAVMDISMLPFPKTQMKTMLKSVYAEATAWWVEVGYFFLSRFQDGVGAVPIDAAFKRYIDPVEKTGVR
jgi:hypothetical protein